MPLAMYQLLIKNIGAAGGTVGTYDSVGTAFVQIVVEKTF
jgi:hypothetical protein